MPDWFKKKKKVSIYRALGFAKSEIWVFSSFTLFLSPPLPSSLIRKCYNQTIYVQWKIPFARHSFIWLNNPIDSWSRKPRWFTILGPFNISRDSGLCPRVKNDASPAPARFRAWLHWIMAAIGQNDVFEAPVMYLWISSLIDAPMLIVSLNTIALAANLPIIWFW